MCLYITITILLWVLLIYPFIKHYTIVVSIITIQFSHMHMLYHRGITLLSTFGKLYETALLIHSKLWFEQNVDKRQGAAQSNCSRHHSSLLLKESINCLTEGGSTAYLVLLDAKQAFDCV